MPLVKGGKTIADPFVRIEDGASVPTEGAVLVPAARFLAEAEALTKRNGPTGVIWPNDRNVAELAPWLDKLALVALVFPTFKDGRAYSQARLVRERYGFRGEMRATGQVLRDQFLFLLRAGFDSFEVSKAADAAVFVESTRRFDVFYQPTGDGRVTVARERVNRLGAQAKRDRVRV